MARRNQAPLKGSIDHACVDSRVRRCRVDMAALTRSEAFAAVKVVTTTEDLASLAREVGGDKVQVDALAKGYQDPHFVDPKPSFILQVSRADL